MDVNLQSTFLFKWGRVSPVHKVNIDFARHFHSEFKMWQMFFIHGYMTDYAGEI